MSEHHHSRSPLENFNPLMSLPDDINSNYTEEDEDSPLHSLEQDFLESMSPPNRHRMLRREKIHKRDRSTKGRPRKNKPNHQMFMESKFMSELDAEDEALMNSFSQSFNAGAGTWDKSAPKRPMYLSELIQVDKKLHSLSCQKVSQSDLPPAYLCPPERLNFYQLLSKLMNLGSERVNLTSESRTCQRQRSLEQEVWQSELSDMLWLELQAYIHMQPVHQYDSYLSTARSSKAKAALDAVREFRACGQHVSRPSANHLSPRVPKGEYDLPADCSMIGLTFLTDTNLKNSLNELADSLDQVHSILHQLDNIQSLYPTKRAWHKDHPEFNTLVISQRIDALTLWSNIVDEHAHNLSLMAATLYLDSVHELCWPYIGNKTYDEVMEPLRDGPAPVHYNDGLSSDSEPEEELVHPRGPAHSFSVLNFVNLSQTSIYRYYVDRTLRRKGLKKLLLQLKSSLDGCLERTRQAMDDASYTELFRAMNLPSFRTTYLFLARIPLDVVHECLRLRLEQDPTESEPSLLSVKQLIHECKEVMKGSVLIKQYYQYLVSVNDQDSSEVEPFEEDLCRMLSLYFRYTEIWMSGLQSIPEMSKQLKNSLEDEWRFMKRVCPFVRRGETTAGQRFSAMTCNLLNSIAEFVCTDTNACIGRLHNSSAIGDYGSNKRHSLGEYRQSLNQTCRKIRDVFDEARERFSKALGFAKMLRKDLEVAAEFSLQDSALVMDKLLENKHFLVHTPSMLGYLMFVPDWIHDDHNVLLHLLDTTCGREDLLNLTESLEHPVYLVILRCSHCTNQQSCTHWLGATMDLSPNADTTIALSHIAVATNQLFLVVLHSSQLTAARIVFGQFVSQTVRVVSEQTTCHQPIAGSLACLKGAGLDLQERVVEVVERVRNTLNMEEFGSTDEEETLATLFRQTLHQGFIFAFEVHQEMRRLVAHDQFKVVALRLVKFAQYWMNYVVTSCERGKGTRPRWAKAGLDYVVVACSPPISSQLSQDEFDTLKSNIDKCLKHLIGDRQPGVRVASPMPDGRHRLQWGKSCPGFDQITKSPLDHVKQMSAPPTPSNIGTSGKVFEHKSSVEEGEDGGLILQIHTGDDSCCRNQQIRSALDKLEEERERALRDKRRIGQISSRKEEIDYMTTHKKATFRWQRGTKIGEGTFGKVYTAINLETLAMMALKEISFQPNDLQTIKQLADEIKIMEKVSHPNLVKYYGVETHRDEILIFMEYCADGTLEEASKEGLTEPIIRKYTRDIVTGVSYLHDQGVVHRDIKGANIFITLSGPVKLGDFGCATKLKNQTRTLPGEVTDRKGTTAFMAPEVITAREDVGSGRAADVWSVGCVVIQMTTGKLPWAGLAAVQVMFKVGSGLTPPIPDNLSAEGKDFLSKCLQTDPEERSTAQQLMHHNFLKTDVEWDDEHCPLLSM